MKSFLRQNTFQEAIISKQEIRDLIQYYDPSFEDELDLKTAQTLFDDIRCSLYLPPCDEDILDRIFSILDKDESGSIDIDEIHDNIHEIFPILNECGIELERKLRKDFYTHDADCSGFQELDDICKLFSHFCLNHNQPQPKKWMIEVILNEMDDNGDCKLDANELIQNYRLIMKNLVKQEKIPNIWDIDIENCSNNRLKVFYKLEEGMRKLEKKRTVEIRKQYEKKEKKNQSRKNTFFKALNAKVGLVDEKKVERERINDDVNKITRHVTVEEKIAMSKMMNKNLQMIAEFKKQETKNNTVSKPSVKKDKKSVPKNTFDDIEEEDSIKCKGDVSDDSPRVLNTETHESDKFQANIKKVRSNEATVERVKDMSVEDEEFVSPGCEFGSTGSQHNDDAHQFNNKKLPSLSGTKGHHRKSNSMSMINIHNRYDISPPKMISTKNIKLQNDNGEPKKNQSLNDILAFV